MDNKEINNYEENTSSHLQDYEIEIPNKKNFFTSFLDKFKLNKNQKLLDSGNRPKTTTRSISSLWRLGNIKASLFHTLDSVKKIMSNKFSSEPHKNSLIPEIIGENLENQKENDFSKDSIISKTHDSPIIPVTEQEKNSSRKSNKPVKIEITTIDTSAIVDKKHDINKKISSSSILKNTENTLEEK